jgi:oligopeptide/dipeptide ABC transporter ATP-binding protein
MAVVLVTHDLGVVAEVCDRVLVMYAGEIVEEGPVEAIFRDPRHPYTEGLLQAIPRLSRRSERLAVIPGIVPAATDWPPGCRFHDRCPYGWELCVEQHPPLLDAPDGRRSRCWLEEHPERRAEVRRERGGFGTDPALADTPPEGAHDPALADTPADPAHRNPSALGHAPPPGPLEGGT